MKKTLLILILCFSVSGCSYKVTRAGYVDNPVISPTCDVKLVRNYTFRDSIATHVGRIGLHDSGLTTTCSEANAIALLQKEACSMGANLVNITKESRPDMGSSCYRCEAGFYKIDNEKFQIETDPEFTAQKISARVSKDRRRKNFIRIGSVVVGIVVGLLTT